MVRGRRHSSGGEGDGRVARPFVERADNLDLGGGGAQSGGQRFEDVVQRGDAGGILRPGTGCDRIIGDGAAVRRCHRRSR